MRRLQLLLLTVFLSCVLITSFAQTGIRTNKATMSSNASNVSDIDMKKAETVYLCLVNASMGLQNVIVDHYKEAIRIISATPNDSTPLVYQPDGHAPESYMEMIQKRVFQSPVWLATEKRLMIKGGKNYYDNIMKSYDNIGLICVTTGLPTKEQWMNRFILPNFRATFASNLYWGYGNRIEEKDLPIVLMTLNAIIKQQ